MSEIYPPIFLTGQYCNCPTLFHTVSHMSGFVSMMSHNCLTFVSLCQVSQRVLKVKNTGLLKPVFLVKYLFFLRVLLSCDPPLIPAGAW